MAENMRQIHKRMAHGAGREVAERCMHASAVHPKDLPTHYWVMMANSLQTIILFTEEIRGSRQEETAINTNLN